MIGFVSIFLVLINVVTFFLYVIDKQKAIKDKRRISERALLFFTLMCGGIGASWAMSFTKHKTKKWQFRFAFAIGLLLALTAIYLLYRLTYA
jgi:uncharacterized membrane protein YsdA (DUF1294 family)